MNDFENEADRNRDAVDANRDASEVLPESNATETDVAMPRTFGNEPLIPAPFEFAASTENDVIVSSSPRPVADADVGDWSASGQAARFGSAATTAPDLPPVPPVAPAPWWAPPGPQNTATPTAFAPAPVAQGSARTGRAVVIGAISGALVGALVTGGLFIAFRDDDNGTQVADRANITLSNNTSQSVRPVQPASDGGVDVQAVLARMRPAVVEIKVQTPQGTGGGTGFIVASNGTIVTNSHVVDGARAIKVKLADGDEVDATVKGQDPSHDLAVITIDRAGLPAATLGDSDQMNVGDPVVAIGNALGLGISVTTGIVSGVDREVNEPNGKVLLGALQTDAAINPGNSGGPLVNARGEVIGINTAIASPQESNNVGFAISISSAKPIIEALAAGRTPKDAFLGVATEDVTPSLVRSKSLKASAGAYVTDVPADSPAANAGIKQGDVIVELGGAKVTGREQLRRLITRNAAGKRIAVVVVKSSGERNTLTITLGVRPTTEQ